MPGLRNRLPTRREALRLFLVTVLPVHIWAIIKFFYAVPALVLGTALFDLLGILAYVLVYALVESCLIFGVVLLLAIVLPRRWFLDHFMVRGTIIVTLSVLWLILYIYSPMALAVVFNTPQKAALFWGIFIVLYGFAVVDISMVTRRLPKAEQAVLVFIDKAVIVAVLYVFLDIASILLIAFRLLF